MVYFFLKSLHECSVISLPQCPCPHSEPQPLPPAPPTQETLQDHQVGLVWLLWSHCVFCESWCPWDLVCALQEWSFYFSQSYGIPVIKLCWPSKPNALRACILSCVRLFATPWTVACQVLLSMEFSRQEILEWVAISFSPGSSQPRDQTHFSCFSCIGRWILGFPGGAM